MSGCGCLEGDENTVQGWSLSIMFRDTRYIASFLLLELI
jgi:hypothetical protein